MFMSIPGPAAILGTTIPLLILDVLAVSLRFYARRKRRQPLEIDDWLTIPSLILVIGLSSIMFYGIESKTLGYPAPPMPEMVARSEVDASDWTIVTARRLEYSFLVIFAFANGCVKLSILFLYKRLFVIDRHWKNARNFFLWTLITLMGLWAIAYTFTFMFMCKGKFEILFTDLLAVMVQCVDTFKVGYSCSISDFIGDAIILLVPLPFIWQLRLPLNSKIAVTGVFLLGSLAAAASLIRMLWMIWAYNAGLDSTLDEELLLTSELFWCLMEITIGLLACCLPTLRGLLKSNSVDSIFKGVRSMFSMRSSPFGSKGSTAKSSGSLDRGVTAINVQSKTSQESRYDDSQYV